MKGAIDFPTLCTAVSQAVTFFTLYCKKWNPHRKTAGMLVYEDLQGKAMNHLVGYGVIEHELCLTTARKKIAQLKANPTHFSSFQSRNPNKGFWGGGFFVPGVGYFALSGLPERGDEACLMCGLLHERIVLLKYAEEAISPSNNQELLFDVVRGTKLQEK